MEIDFSSIERLVMLSKNEGLNIENELFGLIQIFSLEKYGITSTYRMFETHRSIQMDITKSNAVDGYEKALENLKREMQIGEVDVYQLNIVTENNGYLFFTSVDLKFLIGVLTFKNQRLNRNDELTTDGKLRGSWTTRKFFFKGNKLN